MNIGLKLRSALLACAFVPPCMPTAAGATAAVPNYQIKKLGEPGYTWSAAYDINDAGVVVGAASFGQQRISARLWGADGTGQALPTFEGNVYGEFRAQSISDTNVVLGQAFDAAMINTAVFWIDGNIIDAGLPRTENQTVWASSISPNGRHAVANVTQYSWDPYTGFQVPRTDTYLISDGQINHISSADLEAWAVNSSGVVVGNRDTADGYRAFRWEAGVLTDVAVPAVPDSSGVFARAINDRGEIGGDGHMTESGLQLPFVVDTSGVVHLLDLPATASSGGAGDQNDAGLVVGGYWQDETIPMPDGTSVVREIRHGVVWKDGVYAELLDISDASTYGWSELSPNAVNNRGQIAGFGMIGGEMHAFLLTPVPEPGTVVLSGGGLALLVLVVRRRVARAGHVAPGVALPAP